MYSFFVTLGDDPACASNAETSMSQPVMAMSFFARKTTPCAGFSLDSVEIQFPETGVSVELTLLSGQCLSCLPDYLNPHCHNEVFVLWPEDNTSGVLLVNT